MRCNLKLTKISKFDDLKLKKTKQNKKNMYLTFLVVSKMRI